MLSKSFFIVCVAVLSVLSGTSAQTTQNEKSYKKLKIEDGYIRGIIQTLTESNKTVYSFRGIPFAKPPIGERRFEPPETNDKWEGILNTTNDRLGCVQSLNPVIGSEDCLHINVYTPNLEGNLPVLVWIYGGGFIQGNSSYDNYRPDPILQEKDVIVVAFNYRVGVFGFLSTGDRVVPGNNGLKDQCLALKWVQRNIKFFGGDPNKVTIFGESAGAASVSYQLQSKCSKGLYRAAIMQSGTSLNLWALTRNASRVAFEIGLGLDVDTTNSTILIKALKKVPYQKLQEVSLITGIGVIITNPLAGLMFSPVIEPPHENAFFSYYSEEILSQGQFNQVPIIIGLNSNEANVANDIPGFIRLYFVRYDLDFSALAPADLTNNTMQRSTAAFEIRTHYFGLWPLVLQNSAMIKFISDDQFNRPIRQAAIQMAKYVPVYFYRLSYKGLLGAGSTGYEGVGHAEDLYYLFNSPNEPGSPSDQLTRKRLVKLWTNFAKYGNPTPQAEDLLQNVKWEKTGNNSSQNLTFLDIDRNLKIMTNPFQENMQFYDQIYKNYGSPPFNTY